jgi:ribonuclease-3
MRSAKNRKSYNILILVDHPVQETTLNYPYQVKDNKHFASVHLWLDAIYSQASHKIVLQNSDILNLAQISSLQNLENQLNYSFLNKEFLINALTQSTFCYEFKELGLSSNERMEFIGDSLINLIVAKILFQRYPKLEEGDLSKLRGALVNEQTLSKLANTISLGENILLGKGEHKNNGEKKESLLADAFEALFAAIYFDGLEQVDLVEKAFLAVTVLYEQSFGKDFFAVENLEEFDSKTQLQELSMALFHVHPTYKFIEEKSAGSSTSGFKVELWIGERKLAEGIGPSKKKIEKELARIVLDEKRYQ